MCSSLAPCRPAQISLARPFLLRWTLSWPPPKLSRAKEKCNRGRPRRSFVQCPQCAHCYANEIIPPLRSPDADRVTSRADGRAILATGVFWKSVASKEGQRNGRGGGILRTACRRAEKPGKCLGEDGSATAAEVRGALAGGSDLFCVGSGTAGNCAPGASAGVSQQPSTAFGINAAEWRATE